jgi:fusion and transport protein UGO1
MYHIVFEEGERAEPANGKDGRAKLPTGGSAKTGRRKKGQGLEGLFRGWRVGMWGLVGVWAAATLGGVAGKGAEF